MRYWWTFFYNNNNIYNTIRIKLKLKLVWIIIFFFSIIFFFALFKGTENDIIVWLNCKTDNKRWIWIIYLKILNELMKMKWNKNENVKEIKLNLKNKDDNNW